MPGSKIKLLIVDDSIMFRKTLCNAFSADSGIDVIGTAIDPYDAMEKIKLLKPDVVTLDIEMPKLNGIEFLKKIIPTTPLPVVVVSSLPINALDALDAGAVDFVKKPLIQGPNDLRAFVQDLSSKIKIAATAQMGMRRPTTLASALPALRTARSNDFVIAIGASTGGTEAILAVIKDLPVKTPGIVIVQHMPPVFTKMYAERLNKICKMEVKEAQHGDRVQQGRIIIAAGEFHMRLAKDAKGYFIKSERGEKVSGHCPSVDVLFDSVAEVAGKNAMGAILTGMGADGAKGLLKMRQNGAYTIGQDKESCVVYGMPMVSFNIGSVVKQFPLSGMESEIIRHLNSLGC